MTAKVFDIAIIGGGIIGLSIARALCGENRTIAVIDAGVAIPPATNAAAGMLAPSFEAGGPCGDALYDLGAMSLALWPDFAAALEKETGAALDYRADGILGIAFTGADVEGLRNRAADLTARGAAPAILSGEEARALEPALSEKVIAAIYAERDAQVDARKILIALRGWCAQNVGPVLPERAVAMAPKGDATEIVFASGGRIEAATIVLANGAAAGVLDGAPPYPVFPVKGEALAVQMRGEQFRRVIRGPGAYLCPKAGGRVIIGGTEVKDCDDREIDPAAIQQLRLAAIDAVPAAEMFPDIERWSGLRPATPDGAPILGCDCRGPGDLIVALGHYRNGILLAPATAAAIAAEILGRSPVADLKPFSPERFDDQTRNTGHG